MITKENFQTSLATLSQIFPSIKKDLEAKTPAEQQAEIAVRYRLLDDLNDEQLTNATKAMCQKHKQLYPGDNWSAILIDYAKPRVEEEWTDVVKVIRDFLEGTSWHYDHEGCKKAIARMKDFCPLAYVVCLKLGFQNLAEHIYDQTTIAQIRMAVEAEKKRAEEIGAIVECFENDGHKRVGRVIPLAPKKILEQIKANAEQNLKLPIPCK